MTRQNVTEGVREILTRTCPTCGGEGVVLSEDTMAVEAERRLRKLARASGSEAFLIKVNAKVASLLVGPGGAKLLELERDTGKFFSLEPHSHLALDEIDVIADGYPRGDPRRASRRSRRMRWCGSRSPSRTCTTPPTRSRTSMRTRS